MGIFKRMKAIAVADINSTLDKFEDPVSMLKQYLRDLEKEMDKAQAALSNQLYIEKKYEALIEETIDVIQKRTRQTELAVDRNEDDIAKIAIQDKLAQEKKLKIYQEQYEAIKGQTSMLYEQLDKLKETYEELENRKLLLISRVTAAQVSNDIGKALVSINPENAVRGFQRMEEEVLKLEAQAQANNYLYKSSASQRVNKLDENYGEEVYKELERLKAAKSQTASV